MPDETTIYASIDAANDAMPHCPKPLQGSGGYHWWYIDRDAEAENTDIDEQFEYVSCICKTCEQKMRLDAGAEEYPV